MSALNDFHQQADLAAGLVLDASCACRAIGVLPLPMPHRRHLHTAIVALEKAQQALFAARNDPWSEPSPRKSTSQLALL